ncbi:MAG: hypothetical protein ACPGDB_02620 [Fusobacterium sp.]
MKEPLISFETAKLAKEKGFWIPSYKCYDETGFLNDTCNDEAVSFKYDYRTLPNKDKYLAPTQSLLQKFIRETRGVHIEIHRNASGYYWSMCKADGGTNLGWSDHTGPNYGGVWDSFEGALENALQVQLSYDLPKGTKVIKHWGNYVEFAIKHHKKLTLKN